MKNKLTIVAMVLFFVFILGSNKAMAENKVSGKNLFNKATITSGKYIDYTNGKLINNVDTLSSDFIAVLPNTTYTISNASKVLQFALYNTSKVYSSGKTGSTTGSKSFTFTTSATECYVRLTVESYYNSVDTLQLELGNSATSYEAYGGAKNENKINNITVNSDGTGDYSSLNNAIKSVTDASKNNIYNISIYEGTYNVFSGLTDAQINSTSFKGLFIPNYVNIIGIGNKDKIIIKGELADSFSYDTMNRVSVLHAYSICDIQNVTIIGKNTRYTFHDDFNIAGIPARRTLKNCTLIKLAGGGLAPAYGAGCMSGAEYTFINCDFISELGVPFSLHNNINFTERSYYKLENCRAYNKKLGAKERYSYSFEFPDENSGTDDIIEMNNCYAPNGIDIYAQRTDDYGFNATGKIGYMLKGYGNTISPNTIKNFDNKQYFYEFNEETERHMANENLVRGDIVKLISRNTIGKIIADDNTMIFAGIVLKDAVKGKESIIKTKGYIYGADINFTSFVLGDKIGIVNGKLKVVTTGDYIGICKFPSYIYLN